MGRCLAVVDPVMVSTSGDPLLEPNAVSAFLQRLLPLATVLTPNVHEARLLLKQHQADQARIRQAQAQSPNTGGGGGSGRGEAAPAEFLIRGVGDMERAALALAALGPDWVLLKGGLFANIQEVAESEAKGGDTIKSGEATQGEAVDVLCHRASGRVIHLAHAVVPRTCHTHGTGCTLASRIAAELAKGAEVPKAVEAAKAYVHGAIKASAHLALGTGVQGPMNHHWETSPW